MQENHSGNTTKKDNDVKSHDGKMTLISNQFGDARSCGEADNNNDGAIVVVMKFGDGV